MTRERKHEQKIPSSSQTMNRTRGDRSLVAERTPATPAGPRAAPPRGLRSQEQLCLSGTRRIPERQGASAKRDAAALAVSPKNLALRPWLLQRWDRLALVLAARGTFAPRQSRVLFIAVHRAPADSVPGAALSAFLVDAQRYFLFDGQGHRAHEMLQIRRSRCP